ncbi:hypothetical protein RCL_jg6526.t1 [Rhizophagus clarus]|uniref:Uncharacterized protein n=1 Tax=Rhizophagus clarus TaxID=94130 RepID=A0A8H3LBY1_9GLOM|nr:hypothetical protein RCL_jg6526.t1 [Rhizophagus clarus]
MRYIRFYFILSRKSTFKRNITSFSNANFGDDSRFESHDKLSETYVAIKNNPELPNDLMNLMFHQTTRSK